MTITSSNYRGISQHIFWRTREGKNKWKLWEKRYQAM